MQILTFVEAIKQVFVLNTVDLALEPPGNILISFILNPHNTAACAIQY